MSHGDFGADGREDRADGAVDEAVRSASSSENITATKTLPTRCGQKKAKRKTLRNLRPLRFSSRARPSESGDLQRQEKEDEVERCWRR